MKLVGGASAAAAIPGLAGRVASETTRHGITFDSVVDAVADLGMDPDGNEPIDSAYDSAIETGTLVEFPPGEYLLTESHLDAGVSRFGIRGTGSNRTDVQFLPESGSAVAPLEGGGPGPFMIENVSFHERDDETSMVYLGLSSEKGVYVGDVEFLGRTPRDDGNDYTINADVHEQDAVSVFENVFAGLDKPAVEATYPDGVAFFRAGPSHEGEVVLRNPVIHERNSAATRLTNCSGVTTIEGGAFVNNQNANIRFTAGDHPSKVSSATGTYIRVDDDAESADAIRLDGSGNPSGAVFRDLDIEWEADRSRGVIAFPRYGDHGGATFRNCTVRNDGTGTRTVNADPTSVADDAITIENCAFTGSGEGFDAAARGGSVIRDSCIDMPNASVRGFETVNVTSRGCRTPEENGEVARSTADGTVSGDATTREATTDGAVSGERASGEHRLAIRGTGTVTEYVVAVSGELDPVSATIETWDEPSGSGAVGWVTTASHVDEYVFTGEITSVEFRQGEAEISVDGAEYSV